MLNMPHYDVIGDDPLSQLYLTREGRSCSGNTHKIQMELAGSIPITLASLLIITKLQFLFFPLNYLFLLLFNLIPHYICCLQNQYWNCMHLIVQIYFELYLGGLISKLLLLSFIFFNCHLRIKYKVLI